MSDENKKYEKVLDLLKRSKPVFTDPEAITEKIMRQLQQEKSKVSLPELIIEYLFGWVYVGWIRRSLVATALMVVVFFGYQQTIIMKRINDLTEQRIPNGELIQTDQTDNIENRLLIYRLTGRKFSDGKITVSDKEINDLIRSVNKLQVKYRDILDLIDNDPQLKKYVEEKINEIRKK
jgi:hypothetical protein